MCRAAKLEISFKFRAVQRLAFCYLCGKNVNSYDSKNRDHLSPTAAFDKNDRNPVLWLPTHYNCNWQHKLADEKIGQLISLKRHHVPVSNNRKLRFQLFPRHGLSAISNLDIDSAIWRWVRGFHAALYEEFIPDGPTGALVTPFPRLRETPQGAIQLDPILQQHLLIVRTLKTNRVKRNLDIIRANNRRFIYECVWIQDDAKKRGYSMFAINIYDWTDMVTKVLPTRDCVGCY